MSYYTYPQMRALLAYVRSWRSSRSIGIVCEARRWTMTASEMMLCGEQGRSTDGSPECRSSTHTRTWRWTQFDEDRAAMLERARAAGVTDAARDRERQRADGAPGRRDSVCRAARLDLRDGGDPSARRERGDGGAFRAARRTRAASARDRLGRNGPRLLLRPFAARRAATGLAPAARAGARGKAADRDPLPRCVGRLPGDPRAGLGAERARRNFSLLYGDDRRGAARAGHGISGFVRGQRDVPENAASARRGAGNSAGKSADRDGFAFSSAAGTPRQAERAGICG